MQHRTPKFFFIFVLLHFCTPPCSASEKVVVGAAPLLPQQYLLLDDRNILQVNGDLKIEYGVLQKASQNPLFMDRERPWEMRIDNMQPNVYHDSADGKWKCWYNTFTECVNHEAPACESKPAPCSSVIHSHAGIRNGALCYADSSDGIHWTKPDLGLIPWKNFNNTNIVIDFGTTEVGHGVYLDEHPEATSKWKMLGVGNIPYSRGEKDPFVATSHDGLHWTNYRNINIDTGGKSVTRWDTHKNVIWDGLRNQWIGFCRSNPTQGNIARIQSYTHSLSSSYTGNWSVVYPTGLNSSEFYQPDALVAFEYEGIYLGFVNIINLDKGSPNAPGTVTMELAWSADGRQWKYLVPNKSFVPLGQSGDFDSCSVFGAKQAPARSSQRVGIDQNTMQMWYAGCSGPFFGPRACGLGLATLQRHGWAGYKAGASSGEVVTVPIKPVTSTLRVTLDAPTNGTGVVVGYTGSPNKSAPLKGKLTDVEVKWANGHNNFHGYVDGAVSLIFTIPPGATVFSFSL